MKYLITAFLLLKIITGYSQSVELTGALFIGNSEMTNYLVFYEIKSDNTISGYSISDADGALETKARISGVYNPRKKWLRFEEKSIISTKAKIGNDQFCLLTVIGTFSKSNKKNIFKGTFTSKSSNREVVCDSGTLVLITTQDLIEIREKVKKIPAPKADSLINKNTDVQTVTKPEKIPVQVEKKSATATSLPKTISAGSMTQYKLLSDTVQLDIFDDQQEDGDKITVLRNNVALLTDFPTTQKVQSLKYIVDKNEQDVLFTIISTDEGTTPPNTVKLYLINGKQKTLLVAPLKKNQKVRIRLSR